MTLIVKKAGLLDTFQDCGRFGYRRFGINPNGAMDQSAIRASNILLGNTECEACLEMHFPAPVLKFRQSASFVLTGADFDARLNSKPVERYKTHAAKRGDILEFKKRHFGQRCYLSVKNGFVLNEWLGSESTNLLAAISGFEGRQIRKGDSLPLKAPEATAHPFQSSPVFRPADNAVLRFVPGPDFRDLTALSRLALRNGRFLITRDANRMGFRLEGPPVYLLDEDERISSGVTFGTIQLLPDNQLIVLMADHQTTGGYPNLGTITRTDLSLAAQLGPGDSLGLEAVTVTEAEKIELDARRDLGLLKTGLRLRGAWNS